MGVDALTIVLSLGAIVVLLIFVGRMVKLGLKIALVVAAGWFLYAKVLPMTKGRLSLDSLSSNFRSLSSGASTGATRGAAATSHRPVEAAR